ncbi:Zinc transporter ZupT [bacterium HR37]|nr:Zinc transporter ZupT [bacterium HR37]
MYGWENTVLQVFTVALLTDLATGLGVLPFVFVKNNMSKRWQGIASAVAGGMMISASVFSLANEAIVHGSVLEAVAGMLAGALFFTQVANRVENNNWQIGNLSASDSKQAILILTAMFIHSIPEGVAIGVGYATGDLRFGILLALAIAVHNIPEGIAITLPLYTRGISLWKCSWFAILTSVPQPVLAVPSFLLVSVFKVLLPFGLGFAGGAMIYLVVSELIPNSLSGCSKEETAWGVMVGLVLMLLITSGLGL